jgi:hypothetical protein
VRGAPSSPVITRAPSRWRRPLIAGIALLLVMVVLARLAYLPRLGHGYDLEAYRQWTTAIQDHGLAQVFERTDTNYVGYHYLLWAIGKGLGERADAATIADKRLRLWLKSPGLAGDLLSTVLVVGVAYRLAAGRGVSFGRRRLHRAAGMGLGSAAVIALVVGLLWGLHPALIYESAYWGQNDSLITAFALAAVWAVLARRPALAAVLLVAGATIKPQPLIVAPILAGAIYARSGWWGLMRAAVAGCLTLVVGHLYFVITGNLDDVLRIYRAAALAPVRLTFSAYNVWWLFDQTRAADPTATAIDAGLLRVSWNTLAGVLVLGALAVSAAGLARRRDDTGVLLACGYLVFAFFMVGAGVHERYDLPALAMLLPALPVARAWSLPVLVISVTMTVNVVTVLPMDRLYPQGRPEWLTIAVAALNVAALIRMTWLLLSAECGVRNAE